MFLSSRIFLIGTIALLLLVACKHTNKSTMDQGVIIAEKATMRSSTALVATPVKELKRGAEVDILEHRNVNQRDFTLVRVSDGDKPVEGWLESRFVISKRIVDETNKLA